MFLHAGEHPKPHTRFRSPVLPRSLCALMAAPGASIPTMPGSSSMQPCCCWQPNSSTACLPWKSSWEHPLPFPQMPFTLALKACYKFFQGRSLLCSLAPKGKQNQQCQRVRNYQSLWKSPMRVPGNLHSIQHVPELTSSCWGEAAGTGISSSRSPGSRSV